MDTVWRQAVRDEAASGRGETTLSALWDLRQFYERISHVRLVSKARRLHFPVQLTRECIAAYRMARNVSMTCGPGEAPWQGASPPRLGSRVSTWRSSTRSAGGTLPWSWTSSWTTSLPAAWARRRRWSATWWTASRPSAPVSRTSLSVPLPRRKRQWLAIPPLLCGPCGAHSATWAAPTPR